MSTTTGYFQTYATMDTCIDASPFGRPSESHLDLKRQPHNNLVRHVTVAYYSIGDNTYAMGFDFFTPTRPWCKRDARIRALYNLKTYGRCVQFAAQRWTPELFERARRGCGHRDSFHYGLFAPGEQSVADVVVRYAYYIRTPKKNEAISRRCYFSPEARTPAPVVSPMPWRDWVHQHMLGLWDALEHVTLAMWPGVVNDM